jgi:hypothetical protein
MKGRITVRFVLFSLLSSYSLSLLSSDTAGASTD